MLTIPHLFCPHRQGPEWHALRTEMTTEMVNRKIVEHTIAKVSLIADELVDKLRSARRSDDGDRLYGFDDFIYQFMLEGELSGEKLRFLSFWAG